MERYSLYIDHQLISQLIRQLENIIKVCHQELDYQHEYHQLRTSIYDQFLYQITSTYNQRYAPKGEYTDIKNEEKIKFYQMTAKLDGIKQQHEYDEPNYPPQGKIKKGRPSKNQLAEENLVQWIKTKIANEGQLKFPKKEIDSIYHSYTHQEKLKIIPVTFYLRILKNNQLNEVTIIVRGGYQRTVADLLDKKNSQKKENTDFIKSDQAQQSEYDSTFEKVSQSYQQFPGLLNPTHRKKKLISHEIGERQMTAGSFITKKQQKIGKKSQKERNFNNIFDLSSQKADDDSQWQNVFSFSNESFDNDTKKGLIYQNSQSFE